MAISYEVTTTGQTETSSSIWCFFLILFLNNSRSSLVPWYSITGSYKSGTCNLVKLFTFTIGTWLILNFWFLCLIAVTFGANFRNSATQFGTVESGPQTRNGPVTLLFTRKDIAAIHCIVFPSPISSAKMPLTPFSYKSCKNGLGHLIHKIKIGFQRARRL